MSLTVHCIVKNEENFIWYALQSVVRFADKILVFDTGSEDRTVSIIKELQVQYPIIALEEKGPADHKRHTELRQEMIDKTETDWLMILDGDEVWTERAMREAVHTMQTAQYACLIAPFFLCVGDVYHYSPRGAYTLNGVVAHATPRFFLNTPGLVWKGAYNQDAIYTKDGMKVFESPGTIFLKEKFWHLSHLLRSSKDDSDYSSGSQRKFKRRLTYFFIGKKIADAVPEVFVQRPGQYVKKMSIFVSIKNFIALVVLKINKFFYEKKLSV